MPTWSCPPENPKSLLQAGYTPSNPLVTVIGPDVLESYNCIFTAKCSASYHDELEFHHIDQVPLSSPLGDGMWMVGDEGPMSTGQASQIVARYEAPPPFIDDIPKEIGVRFWWADPSDEAPGDPPQDAEWLWRVICTLRAETEPPSTDTVTLEAPEGYTHYLHTGTAAYTVYLQINDREEVQVYHQEYVWQYEEWRYAGDVELIRAVSHEVTATGQVNIDEEMLEFERDYGIYVKLRTDTHREWETGTMDAGYGKHFVRRWDRWMKSTETGYEPYSTPFWYPHLYLVSDGNWDEIRVWDATFAGEGYRKSGLLHNFSPEVVATFVDGTWTIARNGGSLGGLVQVWGFVPSKPYFPATIDEATLPWTLFCMWDWYTPQPPTSSPPLSAYRPSLIRIDDTRIVAALAQPTTSVYFGRGDYYDDDLEYFSAFGTTYSGATHPCLLKAGADILWLAFLRNNTLYFCRSHNLGRDWTVETIPTVPGATYKNLSAILHKGRVVLALYHDGTWWIRVGRTEDGQTFTWSDERNMNLSPSASEMGAFLLQQEGGDVLFFLFKAAASAHFYLARCHNLSNDGSGDWS